MRGPILVVDDEPINLARLRAILEAEHELVFARNGEEALQAVAKHQPALILLDVQMPKLDGYATCRRLKADPATEDIPVISSPASAPTGTKKPASMPAASITSPSRSRRWW